MTRSKWKIEFNPLNLKSKKRLRTRNLPITEAVIKKFENLKFYIHTGKNFIPLKITPEMINCKAGEFAYTRKRKSYAKKKKKNKK